MVKCTDISKWVVFLIACEQTERYNLSHDWTEQGVIHLVECFTVGCKLREQSVH